MGAIGKIKQVIVRSLKRLEDRFWKIDTQDEKEYCVFYQTNFWGEDIEEERNQFKLQNRLPYFDFFVEMESKYHYSYRTAVLIDPKRGWLIDEKSRKLFSKSFPYYNNPFSGRIYYPNAWHFIHPFKKVTTLEQAINVPHGWENYFHFFIETLPQLVMLDELNIDQQVPIIVPAHVRTLRYVKEFFELSNLLGEREIIVQEPEQYIRVTACTHVLKEIGFPKEAFVQLLHSFKDQSFLENKGERKIYLKRAQDKQRSIVNATEIEDFLSGRGYEIVDAEVLSLQEQITLFSSASKIIGIHGAGLTNILFRYGRPLELIEIFPEGHAPEHYKILSATLGYNYSSVNGLELNQQKKFVLPLEKLKTLRIL